MNFNKLIGAGVALASSTMVLGSTMSAPAQAASLYNQQFVFTGQGTLAANGNLTFATANINNALSSSLVSAFPNAGTPTANGFNFGALNFAFAKTPVKVSLPIPGIDYKISKVLDGVFTFNNTSVKSKGFVVSQATPGNVSYSASFETVPEPFTILGTATAFGFGAFMKSKKKKEDKVSA